MPYSDLSEMNQSLEQLIAFEKDRIVINDANAFREEAIDRLVKSAVSGTDDVKNAALWIIWAASQAMGCGTASIAGLAHAVNRGELNGFSFPVMNIRGLNYPIARTMFRAATAAECGAVLFELSLREISSHKQRPSEFTAILLAAAIKEQWNLPITIQGGYFQVDTSRGANNPDSEIDLVGEMTEQVIDAGMYNINMDMPPGSDSGQPPGQELKHACEKKIAQVIETIKPKNVDVFRYETNRTQPDEEDAPGNAVFIRETWDFHEDIQEDEVVDLLYEFNSVFKKLTTQRTNEIVRRHIIPVPVSRLRSWDL